MGDPYEFSHKGETKMGNSYGFCKVRRDVFLSGQSRFMRDSDDLFIEDYNPEYIDIIGDLDREDYLYRLVKPKEGEIEVKDAELANYIKNAYYSNDEQAMVVTLESVNRAIEVLVSLDKKVASMPCDKESEANVIGKQFLKPGEWKYVEDKPLTPNTSYEKVYVSSCKENVDIYKEVEKVYGGRTYHYIFPWDKGGNPGASYIIEDLMSVKNEMIKPENKDYVFLFTWI